MKHSVAQNFYRLGLWYGSYRLIIASSLLLIFVLTFIPAQSSYIHTQLYFSTLAGYCGVSLFQLLTLKFFSQFLKQQTLLFCLVDILCFSSLTFALGGPNLHVGILFVITIFIANLLLEHKSALTLTLMSVIIVVYIQFFGSWFDFANLNNISNSLLLAFLFFAVYGTAQFAVQRFKVLEKLTAHQYLELMQLQDLNRAILEQISMGYLVVDEDLNIILSNPASHQLLGMPASSLFRTVSLQELQKDFYHYLDTHQPSHGERFIFDTVQSKFSIHVQIQKLDVPQQTLTLLIMQDAQKLNQHVQQLKLAALGQLSASIAHEIRNPLASIVQANELYLDAPQEEQQMLNQMISKQSHRIDNIIQSTLNMAHSKATAPTDIALYHFLPQLIEENFKSQQSHIHIKIHQPLRIAFDESQLRQVLINLIQNALQHNHPTAKFIELYAYAQEDDAYIDVIDFGNGVQKENIKDLFSPFFTTEINGTGLGLYLSHSFCEANQAKLNYIKLKSGTCFRIECMRIQDNK
ncbi:sensor histidine kinase [Acinetobacter sp. HY1485]|uniref:sensor histidine kinase n=1 Tax=Acinetobacter sp. HY1485 TaxID=2970918 RepID=UPI0022B99DAF|nr:ATP-binding protein [Acinetobacter sp. HY1485]